MSKDGRPLALPDANDASGGLSGSAATPIEWAAYVLGALKRQRSVAIGVFVVGVVASLLYFMVGPRVYRVNARILVQPQQAASSVLRSVGGGDEGAVRAAMETVHRRESLLAIIKETKMFDEKLESVKPGFFERLLDRFDPTLPTDDPMETLLLKLRKKLTVATGDGTIDIIVEWSNPEQAYALVEAAVRNYLEARHRQEVTAIEEIITLLQSRAQTLREGLDAVLAEEFPRRRVVTKEATASTTTTLPSRTVQPDEQLASLKAMIDAKTRALADVEEFRRRQLADLQVKLDAQRAVYSEKHPEIVSLKHDIASLSVPSSQIGALQEEEHTLRQEYAARAAQLGRTAAPGVTYVATISSPSVPSSQESERARTARFQYQQMLERINEAQVELDAAGSSFKYRYSVVWPAQVPTRPLSPLFPKTLGYGSILAAFLAVAAATLADLVSGRVVARWQIEKSLNLPVLVEINEE